MPEEVEIFLSPQVACVLYFYLLVSAQWITETRITQKRGTFHTCGLSHFNDFHTPIKIYLTPLNIRSCFTCKQSCHG